MFGGDEDDQDFLSPTGGSKLASIFGMDKAISQGGNESLTYTAPKEPKKIDEVASSGTSSISAPAILCASAVFAYKYIDDKCTSQGKVGAALLANHSTKDYKLLLYITKEKPVTFARISSVFQFAIQPGNYASFYDDSRQSWSIMFDDSNIAQKFATEIAVLKAITTQPHLDSIIAQDLVLGDGTPLEAGDSVEVKYTGRVLESHGLSQIFESNTGDNDKLLRLKLGRGKSLKMYDEGIIGMKKGGKRLLIAPPSQAYGSEGKPNKVPSNANVAFEVEVVRVKLGRERGNESVAAGSNPNPAPSLPNTGTASSDEHVEEGVKARSKSISEQLAQPAAAKTDKAKLISRMAKMGQPMLPINQAASAASEVSEHEVHASHGSAVPQGSRPDVPQKPSYQSQPIRTEEPSMAYQHAGPPQYQPLYHTEPMQQQFSGANLPSQHHMHALNAGVSSSLSIYQPPQPFMYPPMGQYPYQPMQHYPGQVYNAPANVPTAPTPAPQQNQSQDMTMMLMETRQQNTEVRVGLSKVTDKVDRIVEKLDVLSAQQSATLAIQNSAPCMEVGMLLHSIQRIVKENEQLKSDTIEKSARIETLNTKIGELLQTNQLYIEKSNAMLEQRNDSYKSTAVQSQEKVLSLEHEKMRLTSELAVMTSQLSASHLELTAIKKKEADLLEQLDRLIGSDTRHREELTVLRVQVNDHTRLVEELTGQLKAEKQEAKNLDQQLSRLRETLSELTVEKESLEKNLTERKRKSVEDIEKQQAEMNEMRASFERELSDLKDRLKSEKSSTELTTAQQVTEAEQAIDNQWKEKCNRLIASAKSSHQREMEEVLNEKQWMQEKITTLEHKLLELKSTCVTNQQKNDSLVEEMEQLGVWKDKYDQLRSQAGAMKERYENRIKELIEERDLALTERERLKDQRDSEKGAQQEIQQDNGTEIIVPKVKSIMSSVFKQLKQKFLTEETYEGSHIQSVMLNVIKTVTLEMLEDLEAEKTGGSQLSKAAQSSFVAPAYASEVESVRHSSSTATSSSWNGDQPDTAANASKLLAEEISTRLELTDTENTDSIHIVSDDANSSHSTATVDDHLQFSHTKTETVDGHEIEDRATNIQTDIDSNKEHLKDSTEELEGNVEEHVDKKEQLKDAEVPKDGTEQKVHDTGVQQDGEEKALLLDNVDSAGVEERQDESLHDESQNSELRNDVANDAATNDSVISKGVNNDNVTNDNIANNDVRNDNDTNSKTETISDGISSDDITNNINNLINSASSDTTNDTVSDTGDKSSIAAPGDANSHVSADGNVQGDSTHKPVVEPEDDGKGSNEGATLQQNEELSKELDEKVVAGESQSNHQTESNAINEFVAVGANVKDNSIGDSTKEDSMLEERNFPEDLVPQEEDNESKKQNKSERKAISAGKTETLEERKSPDDSIPFETGDGAKQQSELSEEFDMFGDGTAHNEADEVKAVDKGDNSGLAKDDDDDDEDLFQEATDDLTTSKPTTAANTTKPLFAADDEDDLFGAAKNAKPLQSKTSELQGPRSKVEAKASGKKSTGRDGKTESDEDSKKPPPLPLFDDNDEDDDDLNWLS